MTHDPPQNDQWGNHCLCEWCCPDFKENMFCVCARNYDNELEPCEHDTRKSRDELITCPECKGFGMVAIQHDLYSDPMPNEVTCSECEGKGKIKKSDVPAQQELRPSFDELDDIRNHLEGSLIDVQEKRETLRGKPPAPHGCPYWDPEKNLYSKEPDNHCTMQFSEIRKEAAKAARAEVLGEVLTILDEQIGFELADNYYHKLKSLREGGE